LGALCLVSIPYFNASFTKTRLRGVIIVCHSVANNQTMEHYTLQTSFVTTESKGNNLLNILTRLYNKIAYLHGCHLYIINQDAENSDHILVTELWDSPESHQQSQSLRDFQEAISQATPLLAIEPERRVLKAVAGKGLL
jgi:quinol monooxygenase YgiN